ncbi:MAG: SUMF1/EgtB/PvdO family nonheme iron enzyme [Myxococcota bacterium]|nr:SUMF1/EgtB/PvdO family nonheme iron enzyme [Myxococcota bacterium]
MRLIPLVGILAFGFLPACNSPAPETGPLHCPEDMVHLASVELNLGQANRTRRWEGHPAQVTLPSFCIDRYEYPNRLGELPRVNVSWNEAQKLCAERSRRLCSSDEWERACRSSESWTWSYGPRFDPKRCNTPLQGADGPGQSPIPLAPSGSFAGCRSPEGVYDLNGNVSEWVADPWDAQLYGSPDGASQSRALDEAPVPAAALSAPVAEYRSLRGGTMWSETFYGQSCHSRHAHPRTSPSDDDGFRCCLGR